MLIAGRDAYQKFYTAVNEEGWSSSSLHHCTQQHATRHTELNSITKAVHVRAYKKHAQLIAGRDAYQKFYTAVNEEGWSSSSLHHCTQQHATRHTELNSITNAVHVRAYKKHAHRRARCLPEILHCSQWRRRLLVYKLAPLCSAKLTTQIKTRRRHVSNYK